MAADSDAHAEDCLRLAAQFFNDTAAMMGCRAQFALMMRQMQSALRTLATHAGGETKGPRRTRPRRRQADATHIPAYR